MAENESLDLGSEGARRWDGVYDAVRKGQGCEAVARLVNRKLCGGLRKAFRELADKGAATGREVQFRLPFSRLTKGELVQRMADADLTDLALSTVSCARYPLRETEHKQCGVCPACLFRRQAMFVAGIREPDHAYKYDIFHGPRQIPKKRIQDLRAFLMQVEHLGGLQANRDPSSASAGT